MYYLFIPRHHFFVYQVRLPQICFFFLMCGLGFCGIAPRLWSGLLNGLWVSYNVLPLNLKNFAQLSAIWAVEGEIYLFFRYIPKAPACLLTAGVGDRQTAQSTK
jgi:hypothetical protein